MSNMYDPNITITGRWTAEITVQDWKAHKQGLYRQGLLQRAPGDAADIDGPIANCADCPRCLHAMHYVPMSKPHEYRAFAVCLECNVASEF
jgi:hypothetical protein